jgi:hypothetical protein
MHDPRIDRAGALAAFGAAAAYLLTGVCAVLMPPELQAQSGITPHEFWSALSREPAAHLGFHAAWIAAGLFGVGAVPALSLRAWPAHPGAVLWSGLLALLGFFTIARSHLMELAWDRKVIPLYPDADPAFQQAVHVVAGLALDIPIGVLTYGAVGVWIAVVSLLGLRDGAWPRPFAWLGAACAAVLLCGVAGYGLRLRPLIVLAVGAGGFVLVPAWFAWAGVLLRRPRAPAP